MGYQNTRCDHIQSSVTLVIHHFIQNYHKKHNGCQRKDIYKDNYQYELNSHPFVFKYVDLDPKIVQGICFLILFIGIVYGISLLAKMITKTLQIIALGLLNRVMGGLFGLIKWLVIISSLILVINQIESIISLVPQAYIAESIAYTYFVDLGILLFDWLLNNLSLIHI